MLQVGCEQSNIGKVGIFEFRPAEIGVRKIGSFLPIFSTAIPLQNSFSPAAKQSDCRLTVQGFTCNGRPNQGVEAPGTVRRCRRGAARSGRTPPRPLPLRRRT